MDYTQYWSALDTHPQYLAAWPEIVVSARRIVAAVRDVGIVIAGPHGWGRPSFDDDGIGLNGDAATDLDGDPFLLPAPAKPGSPPGWTTRFCKTGGKPYDLAVAAVLLRCRLLLPEFFILNSDGDWDQQWRHGLPLPGSDRRSPGARTVVGDLFDPVPAINALSPLPTSFWRSEP